MGFGLGKELVPGCGTSKAVEVFNGPPATVPLLWTPCALGPPCKFLFQNGTNGCPGVVAGGNAISLMDGVWERALIELMELVGRWIDPEIVFSRMIEEGWLTSVAERVTEGGCCCCSRR